VTLLPHIGHGDKFRHQDFHIYALINGVVKFGGDGTGLFSLLLSGMLSLLSPPPVIKLK